VANAFDKVIAFEEGNCLNTTVGNIKFREDHVAVVCSIEIKLSFEAYSPIEKE